MLLGLLYFLMQSAYFEAQRDQMLAMFYFPKHPIFAANH
jgi:hypothetical protein